MPAQERCGRADVGGRASDDLGTKDAPAQCRLARPPMVPVKAEAVGQWRAGSAPADRGHIRSSRHLEN